MEKKPHISSIHYFGHLRRQTKPRKNIVRLNQLHFFFWWKCFLHNVLSLSGFSQISLCKECVSRLFWVILNNWSQRDDAYLCFSAPIIILDWTLDKMIICGLTCSLFVFIFRITRCLCFVFENFRQLRIYSINAQTKHLEIALHKELELIFFCNFSCEHEKMPGALRTRPTKSVVQTVQVRLFLSPHVRNYAELS